MKHTHNITDMNCVYRSNCIAKQCPKHTAQHSTLHSHDTIRYDTTRHSIPIHTLCWTSIYFCFFLPLPLSLSLFPVIIFFNSNLFLEWSRSFHSHESIDYSNGGFFFTMRRKWILWIFYSRNKSSLLPKPTPK